MTTELIQFRLGGEALAALTQRMQEGGFDNLNRFMQHIAPQVGDAVIDVSKTEVLRARYDGQIELLEKQVADLTNRLAAQSEKTGLSGIEKKNLNIETRIKEETDKVRAEIDLKSLKDELAKAIKERDEYEAEIEDLEEKIESYESEKKANTQQLIQAGLAALSNPQGIASGLQGLFGGQPTPMGALPAESSEDADLGRSIREAFADDAKVEALKDVIRFFRDTPKMFDSFLTSKAFTAYINQPQ